MIETECEILRRCKHKNVISMVETFDTDDKLYVVMDLYALFFRLEQKLTPCKIK